MALLIQYLYTLVSEEILFRWFSVKCMREVGVFLPVVFF